MNERFPEVRSERIKTLLILLKRRMVMKNANITKINTLGKVSYIISVIVICILILGIIGTIIGGITSLGFSDGVLNVTGNVTAQVDVDETNLNPIGRFLIESGAVKVGYIETANVKVNNFGFDMHWNVTEDKTGDNSRTYKIDGAIDEFNGATVKYAICTGCFLLALLLVLILVAAFFGKNLSKKLAKCESPFHEDVIRAMKHFAYSLIPFGIASLTANGVGIIGVLAVLVVFLFVYTFSYGAELQKEADELL